MRSFLALLLLLLPASCQPGQLVRTDSGPLLNSTGNEFHWSRDSFPIPVMVNPATDPVRATGAILAAQAWNDQVGAEVFRVEADVPATFPMFEDNGAFPYRGYISVEESVLGLDPERGVPRLGLATVHLKPGGLGIIGEIHSSQILLDVGVTDLESAFRVSFHEFGHSLGLAHDQNDPMSIMWFSATAHRDQALQVSDLNYVTNQVGRSSALDESLP